MLKFSFKTSAILLNYLSAALLLAQDPLARNRGTNPNYVQGDWISYSVARFVTSIALGDQYVYFGTRQSGINRYDFFQNRWEYPFTTSNGLADNEITAVAFDFDTGFLWCASRAAISHYHPTAERWTNYFKDEFGMPEFDDIESIGIASNQILFETAAGRLFESNKFGGVILQANKDFGNFTPVNQIRWFGKRANLRGTLPHFFMSNNYLFDPTGVVEDFRFRSARVTTAVEDNWGNLWLGTNGLGAGRGDTRSLRLEMLDFGLASPAVDALAFHQGVFWMGGVDEFASTRGITAWETEKETWRFFEQRDISQLQSDQIHSITPDGDNLWFATEHGLTLYSQKRGSWKTFDSFDGLSDNRIFDTVANDTAVWAATANGIDRILKKNLAAKDSLKINAVSPGNLTLVEVYDLELMENLLWAATNRGIYVYDLRKNEGGFSAEAGGPLNTTVTSISRYGDEIWFGSLDGIDVYDMKKKQWLGVPEGRFFPNTAINRILADQDAVWAATNQGMLKYTRSSRSWRTFTTEDGLIDNHVNAILLDGDYIWFGTDRGITQFYWNDPNRVD
jgi:ligand-binding sensor domain-containing protein